MPELPIACALTPEQLEARGDELLPGLLRRARSYRDTAGGRVFEFVDTPGLLRDLARTLELERGCCRFLAFSLTLEPDGGPIRLEISGPDGTRQFLDSLDRRRGNAPVRPQEQAEPGRRVDAASSRSVKRRAPRART